MSGFSMKAIVVSGLIGLSAVLGAVSAQAASPVSAATGAGVQQSAIVSGVLQVNHRQGHYNRHQGHYNRPHYRPNRFACSPREAMSKASRMGMRNTRIHSNRSTIRVTGLRHGRPVSVVFGKARGCPVLR